MVKKYENPYLSDVIIRMEFSTPIEEFEKEIPKNINNKILSIFSIPSPRKAIGGKLKLTVGPDKKPVQQDQFEPFEVEEFIYHSSDRKKDIKIVPESFCVRYKEYTSFMEVKEDLEFLLSSFFENVPNLAFRSLSVRYVNKIDIQEKNPTNWKKYINSKLISNFNFLDSNDTLARSLNSMDLNFGDHFLRMIYGMYNPDFPTPIKKKIFILDYECVSFSMINDSKEIINLVEQYHEEIESLFEKSISEGLRAKMGEIVD